MTNLEWLQSDWPWIYGSAFLTVTLLIHLYNKHEARRDRRHRR